MNHDELMNFFEVLTTLRDEYAKGDDCHKIDYIASLAQVAAQIIKCGTIPDNIVLTNLVPYDSSYFTTPVETLFERLNMEAELLCQGVNSAPDGITAYVVFEIKKTK